MGIPIENQNPGQRVDFGDRTLELFAQIGTSVGHVWIVRDPDSGVIALATPEDLDGDRYGVHDPDKKDAGVPADVHANASEPVDDPANTQATDTPEVPAAQESPQTPMAGDFTGFGGTQ